MLHVLVQKGLAARTRPALFVRGISRAGRLLWPTIVVYLGTRPEVDESAPFIFFA
jgi:hypothetical protein